MIRLSQTIVGGTGEEEAVFGAVGEEEGHDILGRTAKVVQQLGHLETPQLTVPVTELFPCSSIDLVDNNYSTSFNITFNMYFYC